MKWMAAALTLAVFSASAHGEELTVALGSCNNQTKSQDFWPVIGAAEPDLFLALGDNVYADLRGPDGKRQSGPNFVRRAYAALAQSAQYQTFSSTVPIYPIWDDHDYGLNDAGVELPFKQEARNALLDFYDFPQEGEIGDREGLYYSFRQQAGDVDIQFIMLDTRWNRTPLLSIDQRVEGRRGRYVPDPRQDVAILGDQQWTWLEEQLGEPADLRIIASSIQVLADSHHFERWGNFPAERQRLFALLQKTKANGVVFVSGDRHLAGFYRHEGIVDYPLYELTASSLNSGGTGTDNEDGPYEILGTYRPENFALMSIDPDTNVLDMRINRASDGKTVRALTLPIGLLR